MDRRTFLKRSRIAALIPLWPRELWGAEENLARDAGTADLRIAPHVGAGFRRRRPSDANWPSQAAWKRLNDEVDGNLIPVGFPIEACVKDTGSAGCQNLINNVHNPYYIGDQPGLTQTLGWVDAWVSKPSVYAVTARNADHVAAAVNFARDNDLRLVVKGGGHSYQGTSNAADSLLVWTRHMHAITMHETFVPLGCEHSLQPQAAVTLGAGTIGMQAYDVVTTRGGKYVQGGGCLTVGLAGLVQSGGFGSYSKHYGTRGGRLVGGRSRHRRRQDSHRERMHESGSVLGAERRRRGHLWRGE
jgi:FAD binding domain